MLSIWGFCYVVIIMLLFNIEVYLIENTIIILNKKLKTTPEEVYLRGGIESLEIESNQKRIWLCIIVIFSCIPIYKYIVLPALVVQIFTDVKMYIACKNSLG